MEVAKFLLIARNVINEEMYEKVVHNYLKKRHAKNILHHLSMQDFLVWLLEFQFYSWISHKKVPPHKERTRKITILFSAFADFYVNKCKWDLQILSWVTHLLNYSSKKLCDKNLTLRKLQWKLSEKWVRSIEILRVH